MLCAKNAGCVAVLLRAEPPAEGEFAEAKPDLYFRDMAALAGYLQNLSR
jgi:phosphoglycolate phosphatase